MALDFNGFTEKELLDDQFKKLKRQLLISLSNELEVRLPLYNRKISLANEKVLQICELAYFQVYS